MDTATQVNREVLGKIVAESIAKINPHSKDGQRWINAIAKATIEIEENPFMSYSLDSHSLLVLSQASGEIYEADKSCGCKAFAMGKPCKHRAAARLCALYIERTRGLSANQTIG